ncbi:PREDICTED: mitogen-activated protein kinase kinase kinase 2-like [Tarenaya hassleriana]|uniref:mitogen-activated protein kinase kinase kinase 2-like n=1 Tax=Tarenaya hassleriana TaxID=28532 RepID=UPI00053C5CFD|nr:PREDICTED: mitogen-activated protein kinase kinase kinase 2-like [Tarenaya hassleriana]
MASGIASMDWVRGETIGYGTFATVSLATPASKYSGQFPPLMAVKSADFYGAASLANEKSVLDQLGHCPEIVRCLGHDQTVENGQEMYNLFLEYASRGNLATHVKKSGGNGLPESAVRGHTLSVLRGLRHIHAGGFAHCDIKLGNILIFDDGAVKIADFGLAKRTGVVDGEETASEGLQIRGTPLYMAPESVNNNEYGSQADVWALGCAVVEMFSGKTAWSFKEGSNFMALLMRIGVGDELPRIPGDLSEEGRDFLSKCFVKDPKRRWTAEMLLSHPFVAVDLGHDDHHQREEFVVGLKKEKISASPKGPFDFPDWVSESLDSQTQYQPFDSPDERIGNLANDSFPDWSVTDNWVTVR